MIRLAVSSGFIAAIIAVIVIDLFAIFFGLSFMRVRRQQRAQTQLAAAGVGGEEAPKAPKPVSRRDFFRRSLLVSLGLFGVQFGAGTIAFLWPNLQGGFGSVINAGNVDDIKSEIGSTEQPFYVGAGRFYVVPYEGTPTGDIDYETDGLAAQGVMPLYQRCVHLGCRVPFCQTSQWFECPCHGSKYNEAGEYKLGPAPRGMDRFAIEIDGSGNVLVDTSVVILGPARGTDTINEPPQGSFCVASG
ncbi:MAG: Rieske 2Fe-2S domain-containing protein [Actinomycetota bacterium]